MEPEVLFIDKGSTQRYILQREEELFSLSMHGHLSYTEAYSLPVPLRRYHVEMLERHYEQVKKAQKN